jgi:predicted DNA-binding transcriptional regulator YafY
MRVESLDWTARVLAGFGCAFTIEQPLELRAHVAALADLLGTSGSPSSDGNKGSPSA